MKKKSVHKTKKTTHKKRLVHAHAAGSRSSQDTSVVLVRAWVFIVLFAIMMGVGVIVGNYINTQLNGGSPTVAGYSTDR